jgi:hypothetical protein
MTALSVDPKIVSLANTLQANGPDAVAAIRGFCQKQIQNLIKGVGTIESIQALAGIVCEKLNLLVHEVWSDADVRNVANLYLERGERVFAFLEEDLRPDTYGVLIRLQKDTNSGFRWIAVIDCRGEKQHRRFFTLWHEIVHRITAVSQYELPFHRTLIGGRPKDPIEKLTDLVAGDLGFFDRLFLPVLSREVGTSKRLTFEIVERVRAEFCSDASFVATLNACLSRVDFPVILVKAQIALKKSERDQLNSPQRYLFPLARPTPQLRAISAIANEAAKKVSFYIPANMRIPKSSIIAKLFVEQEPMLRTGEALENLKDWTSSDGSSLPTRRVSVQARKIHDEVFALVSLLG